MSEFNLQCGVMHEGAYSADNAAKALDWTMQLMMVMNATVNTEQQSRAVRSCDNDGEGGADSVAAQWLYNQLGEVVGLHDREVHTFRDARGE